MWGASETRETRRQYRANYFVNTCVIIKNYYDETVCRGDQVQKEERVAQVVEGIRRVAEILIWEDQNNENLCFGYMCEHNVIDTLVYLITERDLEYKIRKQSLQTISILVQNIGNMQTLYYILSKSAISILLNNTFSSYEIRNIRNNDSLDFESNIHAINGDQEEYNELVSYYIVFLRTLALRLNNDTIRLFYNEDRLQFPLWTNSCYFINHGDQMVRNTSRNIVLNILGNQNESINAYVVYEEIRKYNSNQMEGIMDKLDEEEAGFRSRMEKMLKGSKLLREKSKTREVESNSTYKENCKSPSEDAFSVDKNESPGLVQTITSHLVRQMYELAEFVERSNLEWPNIEEYIYKLFEINAETGHTSREGINECRETGEDSVSQSSYNYHVTQIKATSPITFSYSDANSPEPYNSPVVNQLSTSFYESSIRPLKRSLDQIHETLELLNEIVSLNIKAINTLIFDSMLNYVFSLVIFQNISIRIHKISHCMDQKSEKNDKNDSSLKVYLYLTYQIVLYFYQNNYDLKYNCVIDNIWKMFFDLGKSNHSFGNIFSTLINYANEDSEFVLIFGLIDLHSNYYCNAGIGFGYDDNPFIQLNSCSSVVTEGVNNDCKGEGDSNIENDIRHENVHKYVPNFVQSFVDSFRSYFQHNKCIQDSVANEIEIENRKEDIYSVEIELKVDLNVLRKQKHGSGHANHALKRSSSVPAGFAVSGQMDSSKNGTCRDRDSRSSFESILAVCENHKRVNFDFEKAISSVEMRLKGELEAFYNRINCESNGAGKEYMLYIVQFFEKISYASNLSNYEIHIRPLCLLVVGLLISDITKKTRGCVWLPEEEECPVKTSRGTEGSGGPSGGKKELGVEEVFEGVLKLFFKYCKFVSFRNIMDNVNYILCEHFFEWKEEDGLLISRLFENKGGGKALLWAHNAVSSHCSLINPNRCSDFSRKQGAESKKGLSVGKCIWNLIDTYPFLRWFPNTMSGFGDGNGDKSIYIDKLRINYNNYQVLEALEREAVSGGSGSPGSHKLIRNASDESRSSSNATGDDGLLPREENRIKITLDKFYRVTILRASRSRRQRDNTGKISSIIIFDSENCRLLFTTTPGTNGNTGASERVNTTLVCRFDYKECKPVPIVTRSHKATRYLVGLLVRYKKEELKGRVYLKDIMYELPHRDELLNSPNVSKGAIIQTKKDSNRTVCHLNNILLPIYTRLNLHKDQLFSNNELDYSDYAVYMEFENKRKSQDFIRRLNALRKEIVINEVYRTHCDIYDDLRA
ncbi:hypothetical protein FG386_003704 [Cryptosporidium ryanae]|uniref:uncharacterized protein n=1 Tax=Cryptosporidium ryanae TaxID=515981 RepID=UPI00351A8201|nr:hypothetical protein FG386_003704 [Cryptosporidium ryanae]